MQGPAIAILAFVTLQRVSELVLARRNTSACWQWVRGNMHPDTIP